MIILPIIAAIGLVVALLMGGFDKPCDPSMAMCVSEQEKGK